MCSTLALAQVSKISIKLQRLPPSELWAEYRRQIKYRQLISQSKSRETKKFFLRASSDSELLSVNEQHPGQNQCDSEPAPIQRRATTHSTRASQPVSPQRDLSNVVKILLSAGKTILRWLSRVFPL